MVTIMKINTIKIKSITSKGIQETYDIKVAPINNFFLANGILSHNSGKSVLTFQLAKFLDPTFDLDDVCFNADQFVERIKKVRKFKAVVLDEAFSSANSRGALTEVNKAMVALGTEMRQRNLFVFLVLPTFFDLDRYYALWRCRCLFHVYFDNNGDRGKYIIFPKVEKKYLYLNGKKDYNYSFPPSPYPVLRFNNYYTIDEALYRQKKADVFRKRVLSNQAKKWYDQRNALFKELYHNHSVSTSDLIKVTLNWGARPISMREIQRICSIYSEDDLEYDKNQEKSTKTPEKPKNEGEVAP